MKIFHIVLIILSLLLAVSCDPVTGIWVTNNTGDQILIECTTIYDAQSDRVEMIFGRLKRLLRPRPDSTGELKVLAGPLELKPGGTDTLISTIGYDILQFLGFGTIESINDVVSAMDEIFMDINVYTYSNGTKTLLYDKSYFLDKENIEIKSRSIMYDIK
jgi:hypothetical protein